MFMSSHNSILLLNALFQCYSILIFSKQGDCIEIPSSACIEHKYVSLRVEKLPAMLASIGFLFEKCSRLNKTLGFDQLHLSSLVSITKRWSLGGSFMMLLL